MTVHSFHIFDRKGKTLYTKRYSDAVLKRQSQKSNSNSNPSSSTTSAGAAGTTSSLDINEEELLSEQRKLIFGMLFSLREIVGSLVPEGSPKALHSIRTGASTLHNYETLSGLRFAMYTSNDVTSTSSKSSKSANVSVREALQYIYSGIWVECVIRSPLYRVGDLGAEGNNSTAKFDIRSTNFEKKLESYLATMPWFN